MKTDKSALIAILALATTLTTISAMALHPAVVFLIGWTSGQTLTTAKQATVSVSGAYWMSNSYSYKKTGDGSDDSKFP